MDRVRYDMLGGVASHFDDNLFDDNYGPSDTDDSEEIDMSTETILSPETVFDDFIHLQDTESDLMQASTYQHDDEHLCSPDFGALS